MHLHLPTYTVVLRIGTPGDCLRYNFSAVRRMSVRCTHENALWCIYSAVFLGAGVLDIGARSLHLQPSRSILMRSKSFCVVDRRRRVQSALRCGVQNQR